MNVRQRKKTDYISLFSDEEKKLLKRYLDEYNDLYQKILILTPNEFIRTLIKCVDASLKGKQNVYPSKMKAKIQQFLSEKIYSTDYKFAQVVQKTIEKRKNTELISHYFNGEIIPHCEKDKNDGFYIHSCGEKFQVFKYKHNEDFSNIFDKDKISNNSQNDIILYCIKCSLIYKSNLIKFKCYNSDLYFYSKICFKDDEDKENYLHYATWVKYHCNAIINDIMKCQNCGYNLYLKTKNEKKYLYCKKCKIDILPMDINWKCLICKQEFKSEAKIYNPLEYKVLKICVKEAIVDKIKAIPENLECGCQIDSKCKFFHKSSCNGELFLGDLHGKKAVICFKCDSISLYDGYIWTCPKCLKKCKNIKKCDNKTNDSNNLLSDNVSEISQNSKSTNKKFSERKNNYYFSSKFSKEINSNDISNNDSENKSNTSLKRKTSFNFIQSKVEYNTNKEDKENKENKESSKSINKENLFTKFKKKRK